MLCKNGNENMLGGTHVVTMNVRICFRSKHWKADYLFQSFCFKASKKNFQYYRCRNTYTIKDDYYSAFLN